MNQEYIRNYFSDVAMRLATDDRTHPLMVMQEVSKKYHGNEDAKWVPKFLEMAKHFQRWVENAYPLHYSNHCVALYYDNIAKKDNDYVHLEMFKCAFGRNRVEKLIPDKAKEVVDIIKYNPYSRVARFIYGFGFYITSIVLTAYLLHIGGMLMLG